MNLFEAKHLLKTNGYKLIKESKMVTLNSSNVTYVEESYLDDFDSSLTIVLTDPVLQQHDIYDDILAQLKAACDADRDKYAYIEVNDYRGENKQNYWAIDFVFLGDGDYGWINTDNTLWSRDDYFEYLEKHIFPKVTVEI